MVDGSNLLFQMFYGMPGRILGRNGKPIQGTLGFLGALRKILSWEQPDYAVVLFDGECENIRKTMDADYKANRPDYAGMPEEETPFSQLPDIFLGLEVMGIRWAETRDCEADDWIAGYACTYGKTRQVTIVSQDSDFFQLITDNVRVLRYRGEKSVRCDIPYIREKLGIHPSRYAAFKALTGDPADNIRGADKIGPKTAAQLINRFGDLESLIAGAEEITRPSIRQSVRVNAERIRKNHQLICLGAGAALPLALEDMVYENKSLTTKEVLGRIGL